MKKLIFLSVVSPLLLVAGGCQVAKSENPLSPSVAGPIPGVSIAAPAVIEPRDGVYIAIDQQPVTLLLENAATTGVRPLSYVFEVATDAGFSNKVFVREGIASGEGGRTSLRLPDPLETGRTYYWRAKAQDGANEGAFSTPAHFNIFTPVIIDRPTPQSPVNNIRITTFQPEFVIGNAPRSGPVGAIRYELELSDGDSFANKISVWTFAEQAGQTKYGAPHGLVGNKQYFWHVRATDGKDTGPWSETQVFLTPIPAPTPGPPPNPGPACGPPYPNQPYGIVQCRRSQHSAHMGRTETVAFLREVARDLNAASFSGGPMGILSKTSGNNCDLYSCDIVCNSRGEGWDVLSDWDGSQGAAWIGPKSVPNACQIQ